VSVRHLYDAAHCMLHTKGPRILATLLIFILIYFRCQLADVQLLAREVSHCALVEGVFSYERVYPLAKNGLKLFTNNIYK